MNGWFHFYFQDLDPLHRIGHHINLNKFLVTFFLVQNPNKISVFIFAYILLWYYEKSIFILSVKSK